MSKILFILVIIFGILVLWFLFAPLPKSARKINTSTQPTSLKRINPSVSQVPIQENNILISSPKNLEKVSSPLTIQGKARVFENIVSIRLKTINGEILAQTTAYANSPDVGKFGDFEKTIFFNTSEKEGVLEVYQVSAKDGSEIDKVTIPLLFN